MKRELRRPDKFSLSTARKEAEVIMKNPVFKYYMENKPEKLQQLADAGNFVAIRDYIDHPFHVVENPKVLKDCASELSSLREKNHLTNPYGEKVPEEFKILYNRIGQLSDKQKQHRFAKDVADDLEEIYKLTQGALKGRKAEYPEGSIGQPRRQFPRLSYRY